MSSGIPKTGRSEPIGGCPFDALEKAVADHAQANLLAELAHLFRDPVVMAAVSGAVGLHGHILGSLQTAEHLCRDAADKLRDLREVLA